MRPEMLLLQAQSTVESELRACQKQRHEGCRILALVPQAHEHSGSKMQSAVFSLLMRQERLTPWKKIESRRALHRCLLSRADAWPAAPLLKFRYRGMQCAE